MGVVPLEPIDEFRVRFEIACNNLEKILHESIHLTTAILATRPKRDRDGLGRFNDLNDIRDQ